MSNEKLILSARRSYKIIQVLQVLMIVSMVFLGITLVIFLYLWETGSSVAPSSISLGDVSFLRSESFRQEGPVSVASVLLGMISGIALTVLVWWGLSVLKRILLPMKEGRPFDVSVSVGIRRLALIILIGGFLQNLPQFIAGPLFPGNMELLRSILKEGAVERIQVNFHFSLGFVFVSLLLLLLSHVFRYGEELQRQSDETL